MNDPIPGIAAVHNFKIRTQNPVEKQGMDGYRAKRTKTHLIEPLGYSLLRKTVKQGARVNAAADQFTIHTIASDFRSQWVCVPDAHSMDSARSYTMSECVDCELLPDALASELFGFFLELNEDYIAFKQYMMREGYFVRGGSFLRKTTSFTRPPLFLVDFSRYGSIQGNLVRFPDLPWTFTLFQAELLYGM